MSTESIRTNDVGDLRDEVNRLTADAAQLRAELHEYESLEGDVEKTLSQMARESFLSRTWAALWKRKAKTKRVLQTSLQAQLTALRARVSELEAQLGIDAK